MQEVNERCLPSQTKSAILQCADETKNLKSFLEKAKKVKVFFVRVILEIWRRNRIFLYGYWGQTLGANHLNKTNREQTPF